MLLPVANGADWMPLVKGNYWIYRGHTRWTPSTKNGEAVQTQSAVLTCRMEITEVVRRGAITAAVLHGYPADLAWYHPDHAPGRYLVVRVGTGAYHLFSGDRVEETLEIIRSTAELKSGDWLAGGELWLDAPLAVGKHFGGEPANPESDRYCWCVQNATSFSGRDIVGLPHVKHPVYRLSYLTNPDHTYVGIVRGVGIVSYQYGHHGTISETDLRLIRTRVRTEKAR